MLLELQDNLAGRLSSAETGLEQYAEENFSAVTLTMHMPTLSVTETKIELEWELE